MEKSVYEEIETLINALNSEADKKWKNCFALEKVDIKEYGDNDYVVKFRMTYRDTYYNETETRHYYKLKNRFITHHIGECFNNFIGRCLGRIKINKCEGL